MIDCSTMRSKERSSYILFTIMMTLCLSLDPSQILNPQELKQCLSIPLAYGQTNEDQSCSDCHKAEEIKWRKSAHARASMSLPPHERNTLRCRSCHDDVGLRVLVKEELTFNRQGTRRTTPSSLAQGVDCISCHGHAYIRSGDGPTPHKVEPHLRTLAMKSCDRCHQLPPLNISDVKCFEPHGLTSVKSKSCPSQKTTDHRLKTQTSQGSKSKSSPHMLSEGLSQ